MGRTLRLITVSPTMTPNQMDSLYRRLSFLVRIIAMLATAKARYRYCTVGQAWVKEALRLHRDHGPQAAAKQLKAYYNQAKRVAFGYQDDFVEFPMWTKSDRLQMPIRLRRLTKLLTGRFSAKVFALSVFAIYLTIRVKPVWDTTSITKPWEGKGLPRDFIPFLKRVFIPYIRRISPTVRILKDLSMLKGGPWKEPCALAADWDAYVLLLPDYFPLWKAVHCLVTAWNGADFANRFYERLKRLARRPTATPFRVFRTSVAPDRGGKTRMFTCASYWVQYALFPLHDLCMKILRRIPEDYTYNQRESVDRLRAWQKENRSVFSFDLTNATDRFPLWVQVLFLRHWLGWAIASAWEVIMTQESWVDRDSHPDGTVFVRYNTGQPMGVYSSWPVFALCHHLMVRYAAYRVGVNPVGLYMVLGDDVSIACEKLAHEYRRLLVDCLGVDISIPKSYIPNVLKGIRPAEFAKQLVSHTRVITPLTPDLLEDTFGYNWPNLVVIVRHLVEFWRFKFGVAYTDLPRFIEAAAGRNTFKAFRLLCWPRFPVMPRCYREGTIMTRRFGP